MQTVLFHQNIAWSDIDNDRDLDLIFGMEGPEKHEIYLQGPAGSFTPVGAAVGFQELYGTKAYGMAVGDTDGDGDVDVLSASFFDDTIAWYENKDGAGDFGPQRAITSDADYAFAVFAADLDGDGDLDALSASPAVA